MKFKSLIAIVCSISATALAVPNVLNNTFRIHSQDESTFPSASAMGTGAFLYGTDAGVVYVSNGTQWDPVQTPSTTATTADVALFVSSSGSDSNKCTASGALACLTIQGALNKVPKYVRHKVSVSVASGNFGFFSVSGFHTDFGAQTTTAGIIIDGTLSNSTIATGTATGTATGGSAGSTSTFGTLVDSGQTWTSNDLRGRFINILTGTGAGQIRTIASNNGTTITVAGTWTSPVAGSTYAIQDSATFINTCGASPPSGGGTVSSANVAARIQSNSPGMTVTLRGLSITAACSFAVYQPDTSTLILNRLQLPSGSGTATKITVGGPAYLDSVYSVYPAAVGTHISLGRPLASVNATVLGNVGNTVGPSSSGGTVQNSVLVNGLIGLNGSLATGLSSVFGMELIEMAGTGVSLGNTSNLQGLHIDCTGASTAVGILVGPSSLNGSVSPDHVDFTDCNTAISVRSPSSFVLSASSLTATGVTTYIDSRAGGLITLANTPSGTVTTEVNLDQGASTTTFSAIGAANCFSSLNYNSRVCKD